MICFPVEIELPLKSVTFKSFFKSSIYLKIIILILDMVLILVAFKITFPFHPEFLYLLCSSFFICCVPGFYLIFVEELTEYMQVFSVFYKLLTFYRKTTFSTF